MLLKKNKIFVQIGANDGNDAFRNLVRQYVPKMVVLVEPNEELNSLIKENYKLISKPLVYIENVAIMEEDKGEVKLVIPDVEYRGGHNYTNKHYSLLPLDDWGKEFHNSISAKSMTFTALCDKYKITNINYLQIDTEGYDMEIIKSIDFSKVQIDNIQFERWDFPISMYTRYGAYADKCGINAVREVERLLMKQGYKLVRTKHDIIAMK
jgi:FkbM family methyltransferase